MRHRGVLLALTALALLSISGTALPDISASAGFFAPSTAGAETRVTFSLFYDELSLYGRWVQEPRYGWVWYPSEVPSGWRPYTHGRWVFTEEYGWTWISDWEWGWAPFHYGRWYFDEFFGWVWVPGTDWGPAWVMWRYGGGYIGWAPMPPAVRIPRRGGRIYAGIYVSWWCFLPERRFTSTRIHRVIVEPARNVTILNVTTNITRYQFIKNRIINKSISRQTVERTSGRKVAVLRVVESNKILTPGRHIRRDQVNLYRPGVSRGSVNLAPPSRAVTSLPPPRMLRTPRAERGTDSGPAGPRKSIRPDTGKREDRRMEPSLTGPPRSTPQPGRKLESPPPRAIPRKTMRGMPPQREKPDGPSIRQRPSREERRISPSPPGSERPGTGEFPGRPDKFRGRVEREHRMPVPSTRSPEQGESMGRPEEPRRRDDGGYRKPESSPRRSGGEGPRDRRMHQ